MKVLEKGTDRSAFVHIYVKGHVNPLNEYGQYIDAHDKAVCCYVAVEEGHEIKIDGRFNGVTLTVGYDCLVDGVCRKAHSYAGKSVQLQKHKKLDVETFLCQTSDGVIDTQMSVVPYTGTTNLSKEAPETIGTVVTACTYDNVKEDSEPSALVANFKDVAPQFQMAFEKNCSILEVGKNKREKKKVHAKRPGTEPWAIFRFHYRTKDSIEANKMQMSFDATEKAPAKQEAHPLELDSVPPLVLGTKPAGKNDGDNSVRTSSPPPADMPSTPTKGANKSQSAQPKVVVKKSQTKPDTTTSDSTSEMAPTTDAEPITDVEAPFMPKDLLNQLHSTSTKDTGDAAATMIPDDKKADDIAPAANNDSIGDSPASTPKKTTKKAAKKATDTKGVDLEKSSKEVLKKNMKKADDKKDLNVIDAAAPSQPAEVSNTPTVPHPADTPSILDAPTAPTTTSTQAAGIPTTKDFVGSGSKSFTLPFKKAVTKPAPIDTTTSTVLQKPAVGPTLTTPLKRAPEGTLTPPPDMKRVKAEVIPPLTPTQLLRRATTSPSPRALSLEAQVAEQRKCLEAARKKRIEMAKKKAAVDEKLAPYKQRMTEELERLRQEMAEEEAMMAADEEDYMASKAMLAEFERGDADI
ncbi:hypothetical protein E8E12_004042 [Didymella heteroderae]|uniref:Uncharacterized protein n=1 Tax=Didymella heteroderae TaxID=1769908 RepID=A0A9P4WJW3_9PLEO|nr:hypothetical protein E8E12_004042 [Didymella heteroderae]